MDRSGQSLPQAEIDRLVLLAEHTKNLILFTDAQRRIVWVNSAFEKLTGYTLEACRGKNPSFLQGPETDPRTIFRMRKALDAGMGFREEILNYTKDGSTYWLDLEVIPQRDQNGVLQGFFAVQTDITVRRSREEALEIFRSAVEQCPVSIVIIDADGLVEYANPSFSKATETSLPEARGRLPAFLSETEIGTALHREIWNRIRSGRIWRGVIQRKGPGGCAISESTSIAPVLDREMRIQRFIAVIEDISADIAMEQSLRRATIDAEAANRAKTAFLATMSHEIRTPLNAIIGMASLLDESGLPPDLKEHVRTIVNAGETLLELINDVLDYSKLESRRVELAPVPVKIENLLIECLELFRGPAAERHIELSHFLDPALPDVVLADRVRIKQVLINLLSNAVKFTKTGTVCIGARSIATQEAPERVKLFVKDSGIGISKDQLPILFQPFAQVDSSITRHYGGTGLGLVISSKLVRLMGGEIRVESEPGSGSEFSFAITLPKSGILEPPSLDITHLRNKTLLVVDDVEINRRLLSAFGFQWGMHVIECPSSEDALLLLGKGIPVDVFVLDYQMPSMDGETLAKTIGRLREYAATPKILLTSHHDPQKISSDGVFFQVLQKPLRTSLFKEILVELFKPGPGQPTPSLQSGKRFAGVRLLVAEDNPHNQAVLNLMLKKLQCRFQIVATGEDALAAARAGQYDGIILDVQMPVMDGLTTVRELRKIYDHQQQRPLLAALTANAFPEDETACLAAGFDAYYAKPMNFSRMRELLETILDRKQPTVL